jgi:nucleoid-associated protein YgaU
MNRYKSIPKIKTTKGKTLYATSRYPRIPRSANDIYVYTTSQDRYDILAKQYYGDSSLWWVISIANEDISQDSLTPPIGTQIRIPQNISSIVSNFEKINQNVTLQSNNTTSTSGGSGGTSSGGGY